MSTFEYEIGRNIREVRKKQQLSQEKLAERCGISNSTLSAYERSKKIPNVVTLEKIARVLSVTMERLCFGDESESFIKQVPDEGRKIVNCIYTLWERKVIFYCEERVSPTISRGYYDGEEISQNFSLAIRRFILPIRRLISALEDYGDKKDTFDDPERYLEMLLSSAAREINSEIAKEEAKAEEKRTKTNKK